MTEKRDGFGRVLLIGILLAAVNLPACAKKGEPEAESGAEVTTNNSPTNENPGASPAEPNNEGKSNKEKIEERSPNKRVAEFFWLKDENQFKMRDDTSIALTELERKQLDYLISEMKACGVSAYGLRCLGSEGINVQAPATAPVLHNELWVATQVQLSGVPGLRRFTALFLTQFSEKMPRTFSVYLLKAPLITEGAVNDLLEAISGGHVVADFSSGVLANDEALLQGVIPTLLTSRVEDPRYWVHLLEAAQWIESDEKEVSGEIHTYEKLKSELSIRLMESLRSSILRQLASLKNLSSIVYAEKIYALFDSESLASKQELVKAIFASPSNEVKAFARAAGLRLYNNKNEAAAHFEEWPESIIALDSSDSKIRKSILESLKKIDPQGTSLEQWTRDLVISRLGDFEADVREAASEALESWKMGDPDVGTLTKTLARSGIPDTRMKCLKFIKKEKSVNAYIGLLIAVMGKDDDVYNEAFEELKKRPVTPVEMRFLMELRKEGAEKSRVVAYELIAKSPVKEDQALILDGLKDESELVREVCRKLAEKLKLKAN